MDSPTQLNYVSPSVTRLLGYTVEEAMNKTMEEVFTVASFKVAMKALGEEMAAEQKEHIDQHRSRTLELELKRRDGSVVPVEVNFTFIRGSDGRLMEILAIARDITERKRAVAQLRQSEMRYSTLVEKGNDGIVIIQDGLLRFANSRMTDIYGSPLDELIDRPFIDFVAPRYRAVVADHYKRTISGEKSAGSYEIEILSKEGRTIPVEISASVIEYEGRPADMAVLRDITERKKAERELLESRARFMELANLLPQAVWELDANGNFTYSNEVAIRSHGYRWGDSLSPSDLFIPQDRDRVRHNLERVLRGEQLPGEECTALRKDGSTFPVLVYSAPIVREGQIVGARGITINITERKQAEEKLRVSEERFRRVFDERQ